MATFTTKTTADLAVVAKLHTVITHLVEIVEDDAASFAALGLALYELINGGVLPDDADSYLSWLNQELLQKPDEEITAEVINVN